MRFILPLLALVATPALAAETVTLNSDVFVQRVVRDASGSAKTVLEPPKMVTPGDKLVFVLDYRNTGSAPATGFVATNPIPAAVAYAETASAGAVVSIDGGKSWGALAALKVRVANGTTRAAVPADVTHIRWTFSRPIPAGQGGRLSFQGVVR